MPLDIRVLFHISLLKSVQLNCGKTNYYLLKAIGVSPALGQSPWVFWSQLNQHLLVGSICFPALACVLLDSFSTTAWQIWESPELFMCWWGLRGRTSLLRFNLRDPKVVYLLFSKLLKKSMTFIQQVWQEDLLYVSLKGNLNLWKIDRVESQCGQPSIFIFGN